jgi:hypothetical protein
MTSLSFSAPLPGARVTSLCLAKEKSPRERPPREHVPSTSLCSGCARGRRGSPTAHPCAGGELARILRPILRAFPSPARRVRGAPLGALPARVTNEAACSILLRVRPRWPSSKRNRGPCAAVKAARKGPMGGRDGSRPLAAAPWMARRQARPARTDFSSMDGRKAQHRGGLSLLRASCPPPFGPPSAFSRVPDARVVTFSWPGKRKLPRPGRGAEKDRDVERSEQQRVPTGEIRGQPNLQCHLPGMCGRFSAAVAPRRRCPRRALHDRD